MAVLGKNMTANLNFVMSSSKSHRLLGQGFKHTALLFQHDGVFLAESKSHLCKNQGKSRLWNKPCTLTKETGKVLWESFTSCWACPYVLQKPFRDSGLCRMDHWSHLTLMQGYIIILYRYGSVWTQICEQIQIFMQFLWENHEQNKTKQEQQQKKHMQKALVTLTGAHTSGIVSEEGLKTVMDRSWGKVNRGTGKIIWLLWYCHPVPAPPVPKPQKNKVMLHQLLSAMQQIFVT